MSKTQSVKFNRQSPAQDDLHRLAVSGLVKDYTTPRCNRARLDTGPLCNYDCEFCYYRENLDQKTAWEVVKKRIDYLHAYGITEVDLSGGESSMSPDWFKILDYCNERFTSISCLSHGGTFANMNHLRRSKEHGLKEILFSLHGPTRETHEAITNRPGSFDKILQAIKNAQELGMIVRTNCTVYYRNYKQLENEYADLINSIKPVETNFITLNYWVENNDLTFERVNYADMANGIMRCIDKLQDGIDINIRYAPYCYFKGYEKYIAGTFQHIYDLRDWNREAYNHDIDVSRQYTHEEKIDLAYSACGKHREFFYHKDLSCVTCKHNYICDGIEKELSGTPLTPEPGEKITTVTFYRHDRDKR